MTRLQQSLTVRMSAYNLLCTWQIRFHFELVKESESDELAPHCISPDSARDAELRCEYDRGHNFELEGSTAAGSLGVPQMPAQDFFCSREGSYQSWRNCSQVSAYDFKGPLTILRLPLCWS